MNKKKILGMVVLILGFAVVIPFGIYGGLTYLEIGADETFGKKDILDFYAVMLSAASTIFLGVVAVWQSQRAEERSILSERRIYIYAEEKEIIPMEIFVNQVTYDCDVWLEWELRFISSSVPTNAVITKAEAMKGFDWQNKVNLECGEKVMCNVFLRSENKALLRVGFFGQPIETGEFFRMRELEGFYRKGAVSKEEFLRESRFNLTLELGLYNNGIVTPISVFAVVERSPEFSSMELKIPHQIVSINYLNRMTEIESEYERKVKEDI